MPGRIELETAARGSFESRRRKVGFAAQLEPGRSRAAKPRGKGGGERGTEPVSQLQLVWGCCGCQNWAVVRRFLTPSRRRAGDHPLARPGPLAALRYSVGGLSFGGVCLSWACGTAPPVDVGIDYAAQDVDRQTPGAGLEDENSAATGQFVQSDPSPLCKEEFVACGGLLAGTWEVMDTCNQETRNRKALQIWGQTVMDLDIGACGDAVQSVKSSWAGDLVFDQGVAIDRRLRSDLVEMMLTRDCLNATFDVTIKAEKIASVCSTLTTSMRNCSPVGSACRCSSRRESESDTAGVYGVLGKSVSIGTPTRGHDVFEYCVQGDMLFWHEPGALRHVVLQRRGPNTAPFDPEGVR